MSLVEFLLSNWIFPIYTTHNYPENWLHCRCFLWVFREFSKMLRKHLWWNHFLLKWISTFYSSVKNSITYRTKFREVPFLHWQSTDHNTTKKGTPNYISGNVLWKLREISRKSFLMEYLYSKLQTYKLQPSALRVFKIQAVHKIASTMTFLFVQVDANRFATEYLPLTAFRKNLRGDLKCTLKGFCMFC